MVLTREVIGGLLGQASAHYHDLTEAYNLLPDTRCQRRSRCCSLLPEMTLLEALSAIRTLAAMPPVSRIALTRGLVRYFLTNSVEISPCPFLRGADCLIYQDRFFGCRAYGLWSTDHYERQAGRSRQAKEYTRLQWEHLGVELPRQVLEFQVPYCPHVEVVGDLAMEDGLLVEAQDRIEKLSGNLGLWHELFRATYFADLSVLFAALAFGLREAVATKFSLCRDLVRGGDKRRLAALVEEVPDMGADWGASLQRVTN
jgi:Fe-S-cluster containining protein